MLNAIPAVVTVHGVVTANDGRDATFAQRGKFLFECLQRTFGATRWGVTAIKEGVQVDFFCAAFGCQFNHRHDVIFVAVNATGRQQAHNVHRFTRRNGFVYRAGQHRVREEGTLFDFNIETGQVLVDDTTGAQVNVTHFGVTHLTIRQANFEARRVNQGMRTFCPQRIHDGSFCSENSVILLLFAVAVAIQDHQYHRFFRNRHCDNLML